MAEILEQIICYHCGDECKEERITSEGKHFCCIGCKLVFEILNENNLCGYYDLNKSPGIKQTVLTGKRFNFLDDDSIKEKLISFRNKSEIHITFHIPSIHCSSCIWLLENFKSANNGVLQSRVNFLKKEIALVIDESKTSLRTIVDLLTSVGYEPAINLDSVQHKEKQKVNKGRIIRIGIAGFCFGNIMMLSFPEYFSSGKIIDAGLKNFFSYMNLLISLPVFFYSTSEFFIQSFRSIKHKATSIDIPIAIGIAVIFLRSAYEILTHTGAGFLDSGSGLVFFMLIGRWFQDYTFDSLAFDRDYKSYFPIAVSTIKNGIEKEVLVNELKVNDRIIIRNNEIIPVDAMLLKGQASIDYHFVTGESIPLPAQPGDTIFAGGRQTGSIIELQVTKEVSQSNLTQLWDRTISTNQKSRFEFIVQSISKWFIIVTMLIACISAAYWWKTDIHKAINAFTAVLVIACPCALALSAPFTYGNIIRILGKHKIYLRNYHVLEKLADIDSVVFDKTGTLTESAHARIHYIGSQLNETDNKMLYSLLRQSSHPLSKILTKQMGLNSFYDVANFTEETGQGVSAVVNGKKIKAGSMKYANCLLSTNQIIEGTKVFISFDDQFVGYFVFSNTYRKGILQVALSLIRKKYSITVLTGDNENEKEQLNSIFHNKATLKFNQNPNDKLDYIRQAHQKHSKVLMLGDGLNDAGALLQSDVGISITESANSFTPASDAIMHASELEKLPQLLQYAKSAVTIIIISFIISLLYNFVGLSFAVTGTLSPVIAAILMPISTISLVLFTMAASTIKGRKLQFK